MLPDRGSRRSIDAERIRGPNLKITLDESSAARWEAWHRDFVIEGNSFDDREKSGRLVFLAPDLQTELAVVKFFNLGIAALRPAKREARPDGIERVQAELYCERMELLYRAP